MYEQIGNFIWINDFSTFTLSYKRGKKDYFDITLLTIKIFIVLGLIYFLKFHKTKNNASILVLIFFSFLFFIWFSQLISFFIKPTKNILEYNRAKNQITIKINYFKTKNLHVNDIDSFIIENTKERITMKGSTRVYRYMSVVYCKDLKDNSYEVFVVNPSKILQSYEAETVYEISKISNKICDKINFVTGIKIDKRKLKIIE